MGMVIYAIIYVLVVAGNSLSPAAAQFLQNLACNLMHIPMNTPLPPFN
jgi:hypothetical protein